MKRKSARPAPVQPDRLLTIAELAAKWGWSEKKLYHLIAAKAIPHLRLFGRRNHDVHFRESVVEAWLREREVGDCTKGAEKAAVETVSHEEWCRRLLIPPDHPLVQ
jgi:predicted DNA-binding transcriptional regulator AlpA